MLPQAILWLK
ncbi:hypothetical protein YPPY42_2800, partial [Yersinia pestis PY-42]